MERLQSRRSSLSPKVELLAKEFTGIHFSGCISEMIDVATHRILCLNGSLPEDGDVFDGGPDGRAILLGGLSPLAFPGPLVAPCFSMTWQA